MAKAAEVCMFCGSAPCECDKPAPKIKAAAKPKPAPQPAPAPVAAIVAPAPSPFEIPSKPRPLEGKAFDMPKPAVKATEQGDDDMARALEVVLAANIVHRNEVPRLKRMVGDRRDPAAVAQAKEWRRRNANP